MAIVNQVQNNNGIAIVRSAGVVRLRAHPSAPNGVDFGESVLLLSDEGGTRFVSVTLPAADYSAYSKLHFIWYGGNGLSWSFPVVPVAGEIILGAESVVLGPVAGTATPKYEVCPEDTSGRVGYSSGIKTGSAAIGPAIISVAIDGADYAGSVHTATVEVTGAPTITKTYQWALDGVDESGETAATYTSDPADFGKLVTVRVGASNSYGTAAEVTSTPILLLNPVFAVPGVVAFTVATGVGSGQIDVTIGATLPDAGDGAVIGDSAATLDLLEYTLDGAEAVTLDATPTALEVITITTTPGWEGLLGVRAVSDFPRTGDFTYQPATAAGVVGGAAPTYTGGLVDLESEVGTTITKTWTDYFSGATSYTVNSGVTGPVSTGTGNVTYTGTLTTAEDKTFSVTATNAYGTITRTFHWVVITPKVEPFIKSAFPDTFEVDIGQSIDYDATQHFGGTDLVYTIASGTLPAEITLSSAGRLRNVSPLSTLRTPSNVTIRATNSLGNVTSAAVSVGVVIDPPTALTAADIGVTASVYRYGSKWRTPRMFPTELQLISLGANPATMTNASPSVTVAATGHSIEAGQQFTLDLAAARGVTLTGTFTANSVSAGVSVTFTAGQSATSSGTGGGSGGTLRPLWAGLKWSRTTPDANGLIPSNQVETVVSYIGSGEYQLDMTDPAKRADPDTQTPRTNYAVWAGEPSDIFRLSHQVIPAGPYSAWSAAVNVPLVVNPVSSGEWLAVSTRPKQSYDAGLVGNQGQQFQRCRTWNLGIIDTSKRGWVISQQDENSCRLAKNANSGIDGDPVLWGSPRLDGYFGSKSGGLYLNTDDDAGAGLFVGVAGAYDGGGFGTSQNYLAAGVYIGDGTLNWAKKLAITRSTGPGPYVSGSSGPKKAFTKGGSPAGNPDYYGNNFDRRGNFVARRPQVHEGQNVTVIKTTKALLDADLAYPAGTKAAVYSDATTTNRAVYTKTGASGSGSWTKGAVFLTDAQRPIYVVEQHGSRGVAAISYQALFKSTDGGASFSFVRELAIATYAVSQEGIYFVHVAPNGYVLLSGITGAFLSKDEGANFTRIYTREVSAAHFYGGSSTAPSGIRLGDAAATTNGGVWYVADSSAGTLTFAKTGSTGLPANYNIWDMECAPSNPNRILVNSDGNRGGNSAQGYATDAYLSTNGGANWSNVTSTALPGPSTETFRWGFGGDVAKGHAGFLFCPTNELRVVGFTNQTVSQSIDGGASFQANRAGFFDGLHNRGWGTGPLTGTDPWKKLITVSQDSLVATWMDGTNWAQRCGLSTGNETFRSQLQAAGAGDKAYVSGASGTLLPNSNSICAANRNAGSQSNVMVVLTNRQSDGSYPLADSLIRNLSGNTTVAGKSEWSLSDPDGYCFLGRWGIGNVGAAASAITFEDHSGHEFIGQMWEGTTPVSYWSGGGQNPTTIYRSTHAKGLNGQGSPWATLVSDTWHRCICIDPHTPERVLYVRNQSPGIIREIKRVGGALTDTVLQDGDGNDVNMLTLINADFAPRIPGGAPTLPEASYAGVSTLVSDPNMPGLFYAIAGVHGIPNVWMCDPATNLWKNIAENLPRTLWFAHVHPLTGDLFLDSSMGRRILPPPTGYPAVTYRGALSAQSKAFYDRSDVANAPSF